jgi:deoxycytidylate deaminase
MTLYVVRLNQTMNKYVDSSPCRDCCKKISKLNLKRLVYSTETGYESIKIRDFIPTQVTEGDKYFHSL